MAKRLFVGNLAYTIDDAKLKEIFSAVGVVVSATVITDRMNDNRSRGFGFVEMETDELAEKAIKELNDKDIEGRKLVVNVAREREERSEFRPRRDFGGGNRPHSFSRDNRRRDTGRY
jgi:RNA recognition motif-containing protein